MRISLITLFLIISFSQSEEWIYYNNISNNLVFPTKVHPDGTDSTSLALSVGFLWDVNETGTKFLYGVNMFESNLIIQDGNNLKIIAEEVDQARFTSDENIILYRKEIHSNKKQIISYSLIDSSHSILVDSMPQNYNFVLSPAKDKIMYFDDFESNRQILIVDIEDGNINSISNVPNKPYNSSFGRPYIWALNDFIYFNAAVDEAAANISQLFSINISNENLEPIQLTFFEDGCSLLETYENYSNKIIIVKPGVDTLYVYDIVEDYISPLGIIPGSAMNYAWSADMSKVVFNTLESNMFIPVAGPLQIFDISTGNVSPISSITWDYPIFWRELNTANIISSITPANFFISQNYPNPFNPTTQIKYNLPEDSFVDVTVYDVLGNVVSNLVNANQSSGYKSIRWNATNNQGEPVSAGVYLYKIQAGDFVDTKKMILLK